MLTEQSRARINDALNKYRDRRGLTNDVQLSVDLGISPKTLSFIRAGRISKVSEILIRLWESQEGINE
jgi:hypothetical protein